MTERPLPDTFRTLFEHAPQALIGVDRDARVAVLSHQAEQLLGYDDGELLGRHVDLLVPLTAASLLPSGPLTPGAHHVPRRLTVRRKDGAEAAVEVSTGVMPEDSHVAVVLTLTDLRRRDRLAATVELAERRTRALAALGESALEHLDLEAVMREATALVVDETELTTAIVALGDDQEGWRTAAVAHAGREPWATRGGAVHPTLELALDHQLHAPEDMRGVEIRNSAGPLGLLVLEGPHGQGESRDLAFARSVANVLAGAIARTYAEDHLRELAMIDELTGLASRARIDECLADFAAQALPCSVMLFNVDDFKLVNDLLGHDAGDRLLREVAGRLATVATDTVTVARLGGDEFVVLLRDPPPATDLVDMAQFVLDLIAEPTDINGRSIAISAGAGVATSGPGHGPAQLLRGADIALYRAKAQGRGRTSLFDAEMREAIEHRVTTELALRHAIERDELTMAYQPLVDLRSGRLLGFEALLRWEHNGRQISPADFIPIAERSDLIEELGRWVLAEACGQTARWNRHAPADQAIHIAVNVSARHATSPDLVGDVGRALRSSGLPAALLHVEITETALLDSHDLTPLEELRALGVKIALDDFGTGYSSLAHLQGSPVDLLKVDRSFVASDLDSSSWHIVRAVLDMARALGITTVAEGIETEEQLELLRGAGCDIGQGYLLGRPMPAAQAQALLDARDRPAACLVA
jgi:diguanylate cyclase (GGDEF)-like protein/PAS domain S-box-containing protein